jgi:hypothetical protein
MRNSHSRPSSFRRSLQLPQARSRDLRAHHRTHSETSELGSQHPLSPGVLFIESMLSSKNRPSSLQPLIHCRCRPVHRLSSSSTQVLFNFSYPVPSQHMWLLCSRRDVIGGPLSIPQWHYVAGCLLPKLRILHCCSTRCSMSSLILDLVQILARDSRFWSYPAPVPILALGRRLPAFSILYLRSR